MLSPCLSMPFKQQAALVLKLLDFLRIWKARSREEDRPATVGLPGSIAGGGVAAEEFEFARGAAEADDMLGAAGHHSKTNKPDFLSIEVRPGGDYF